MNEGNNKEFHLSGESELLLQLAIEGLYLKIKVPS